MPEARPLVILTGDGPEHRHVVNRLCETLPVAAIVVDVAPRSPSLKRAFRHGRVRGAQRVAHYAFRRAVRDDQARETALRSVLGPGSARFAAESLVTRVEGINSPAAHAAVEGAAPDALLVYGTAIVRDDMLAHARDVAFNMHTGVSPRYRGTDCAFWPLVNGEPEWLGATVHECTSAVDGGQIFATTRTACEPGDGVHEAFARAVLGGAELYAEVAGTYLAGRLEGTPQDLASGTEYRGHMRTLWPELRARRTLRRIA